MYTTRQIWWPFYWKRPVEALALRLQAAGKSLWSESRRLHGAVHTPWRDLLRQTSGLNHLGALEGEFMFRRAHFTKSVAGCCTHTFRFYPESWRHE